MYKTALIVVDMQNYYLKKNSSYSEYFNELTPGSLDYIVERCRTTVTPNISRLAYHFRNQNLPVIYLKLCGNDKNRNDIHKFFRIQNERAEKKGFKNLYPLDNDLFADIIDELKPENTDIIITKTTFSAFSSTDIKLLLDEKNIRTLVFSGLATSQCVETTARDASDRGFTVIHVEDAQADYNELLHNSSLFVSRGVCGDNIYSTDFFIEHFKELIADNYF